MSRHTTVCGVTGCLLLLAGCADLMQDGSGYFLAGVDSDAVYYEYSKSWSGLEVRPSALWRLDLATGAARRIQEQTVQAGLQAADDYYVTEEQTGDGQKGRLVAVQRSTDERTVIRERDLNWSGSFDAAHRLDRGRVAILSGTDVRLYDLAQSVVVQTIPVPEGTHSLAAFQGDLALVVRDAAPREQATLVDFATGQASDLPPAPGNTAPHFSLNAQLSNEWLGVSRTDDVDSQTLRPEVLTFHIPTQTWRVLVRYPEVDKDTLLPPVAFVAGISAERLLVEHAEFPGADGDQVELVDLQSGARTEVARRCGFLLDGPLCPRLYAGRVFWIETSAQLVVYDIATATQGRYPLEPGRGA